MIKVARFDLLITFSIRYKLKFPFSYLDREISKQNFYLVIFIFLQKLRILH